MLTKSCNKMPDSSSNFLMLISRSSRASVKKFLSRMLIFLLGLSRPADLLKLSFSGPESYSQLAPSLLSLRLPRSLGELRPKERPARSSCFGISLAEAYLTRFCFPDAKAGKRLSRKAMTNAVLICSCMVGLLSELIHKPGKWHETINFHKSRSSTALLNKPLKECVFVQIFMKCSLRSHVRFSLFI